MIRTKGEPGTGDVVQAVHHMRLINSEIAAVAAKREDELFEAAKQLQVPYDLVKYVHDHKKTSGCKLCSRRCGNSGRCGTDDAAWR